jgi:hypothetical protein
VQRALSSRDDSVTNETPERRHVDKNGERAFQRSVQRGLEWRVVSFMRCQSAMDGTGSSPREGVMATVRPAQKQRRLSHRKDRGFSFSGFFFPGAIPPSPPPVPPASAGTPSTRLVGRSDRRCMTSPCLRAEQQQQSSRAAEQQSSRAAEQQSSRAAEQHEQRSRRVLQQRPAMQRVRRYLYS